MYETLDERLLIDPNDRELRHFAQWVKRQGDGRGFIVTERGRPDPYLILFDSYGRTHHSVVMELDLAWRREYSYTDLIFRLSGNVYSGAVYRPAKSAHTFKSAPIVKSSRFAY